ncbi:hypothetical protein A8U91_01105 [Halomonas elongata]|uniref:Uncharacterized protein n=1 Tax=Halomonas elongata TaxID=2746 RepID=A0A1B8P3F0_HALEL|nr:hypothetical protein A8U91_01105 [Halomonas elongata]
MQQAQALESHPAQEQRATIEHRVEQGFALAVETALLIEIDEDLESRLGLLGQSRPIGILEQ